MQPFLIPHATFMSTNMQPFNLANWQAQHGFTYDTASKALGVCRATYANYLKMQREGKELPRVVELACKAVYIEKKETL